MRAAPPRAKHRNNRTSVGWPPDASSIDGAEQDHALAAAANRALASA